jgi:hypothetical protein
VAKRRARGVHGRRAGGGEERQGVDAPCVMCASRSVRSEAAAFSSPTYSRGATSDIDGTAAFTAGRWKPGLLVAADGAAVAGTILGVGISSVMSVRSGVQSIMGGGRAAVGRDDGRGGGGGEGSVVSGGGRCCPSSIGGGETQSAEPQRGGAPSESGGGCGPAKRRCVEQWALASPPLRKGSTLSLPTATREAPTRWRMGSGEAVRAWVEPISIGGGRAGVGREPPLRKRFRLGFRSAE